MTAEPNINDIFLHAHTQIKDHTRKLIFPKHMWTCLNYINLRKSYFGNKGKTESKLRKPKAVVEHRRDGQE